MNEKTEQAAVDADKDATWPSVLNKLLIGIGVIAFGLVIADRLINMFRADDLPPDVVEIKRDLDVSQTAQTVAEQAPTPAPAPAQSVAVETDVVIDATGVDAVADVDIDATGVDAVADVDNTVLSKALPVLEDVAYGIEDVFGSPLVFVSASEPLFVVTEDERRFDVGQKIDEQTLLAGITNDLVIVEKDGKLMDVRLPEPAAGQ